MFSAVNFPNEIEYAGNLYTKKPNPLYDGLKAYYVKEDQFTYRWNFKVRGVAPDPGVMPVSLLNNWPTTDWAILSAAWQWYWVDLLSLAKFGKLYSDLSSIDKAYIVGKFKGLTGSGTAFNNKNGTDKYACYPTKENLSKADPKNESLICIRNKVYSNKVPIKATSGTSKNLMMVELYSFYAGSQPPARHLRTLDDPRVQIATWIEANGTVRPFTNLGVGIDVPFPFLTAGPRYYPLRDLTPL